MPIFFDAGLLGFANGLRAPVLDGFFSLLTWLGSLWVLLPLSELLILCWRGRDRWGAWYVTASLLLASLMTYFLKHVIDRARPDLFPRLVELPADAAFPSAHSAQAAAFALALIIVLPASWRWRMAGVSAVLVLAVGFSRIYLQVHWPTDVLAGYATGVVAALTALFLKRRLCEA